ncbi:alpha/beta fold hydrolase [Jiella sonneratiae]|uniref:Alpha/beta fold hydrolase n=1 Tax=Jiella sonneratiae TaxID=2816856 RepID=A0ABS3J8X5_9HYPH|nr:alpha/beta fold hydrolase [Jiella sonneratiae]MBO0906119.1 alpha/beta fold hydrolase [Jiella sonneratiae]
MPERRPLPLVLIPGMMCDARLFGPQIAAFSAERATHVAAILAKDTVEAMAADLLVGAPARFALAGLSMGGIVAMEVLRQAPERVERIALLDTNPLAEAANVRDGREPQIEKARQGGLEAVMREAMLPRYVADPVAGAGILDLCLQMALALGPAVFERQSRALQTRPDQTGTLRAAKLPTLILCGENDALCPVDRHRLMHDLMPGSRLEILPATGHLPTLERPETTTKILREWLDTQ